MAKKKFTLFSRKNYHEKRVSSTRTSKNKKVYSKAWLDGFNDKHAENNLVAVKAEIAQRKQNKVPHSVYDIDLAGYRNGLIAKMTEGR